MKFKEEFVAGGRRERTAVLQADLVVTGGGLSGVCAAVTAAREGISVILVQDRPILGGNASSEIRLWILGATSHMGNNNRWSREGGVVDEILVENTFRNPEGNPLILDMILLEKVYNESNITLLLNTVVYDLVKEGKDRIKFIKAFCSQNSTAYHLQAPRFCDASGDGIIAFLAGAAFRMGAESKDEFGELMAPDAVYGELLGHSLYFYSKDVGKPVQFIPPSFAMDITKEIPRFRNFNAREFGCKLWWVEHGGRMDTVYDSEKIKWDLWRIVYGVWDYIKNSGKFPEAETMTLEWVGTIPGKRESRRFEGDYMLTQQDIVEQRQHTDAVAYGGWSIDLHPADGVFSEQGGCDQWHSKGVFQIPYRCLYSKNIKNLFLTGRIISVSHVAFGATRVMATSGYVGEAVGMAAALCKQLDLQPKELLEEKRILLLQQHLMKVGHHIPNMIYRDAADLAQVANIKTSSTWSFKGFEAIDVQWKPLTIASGQLLPMPVGPCPSFSLSIKASKPTSITVDLFQSSLAGNFTPDVLLERQVLALPDGRQQVNIGFNVSFDQPGYVFLIFRENKNVSIPYTEQRVTGLVSVFNGENRAVSNFGRQEPPPNMGVEAFEFWCPQRRPAGQNICFSLSKPISIFDTTFLRNGIERPTIQSNAWVADPADTTPTIELSWPKKQRLSSIVLFFDTDFDHPMESVLMTHPEREMPFCVKNYELLDDKEEVCYTKKGNYQTINRITFEKPIETNRLIIKMEHPSVYIPAALFAVRCYSTPSSYIQI